MSEFDFSAVIATAQNATGNDGEENRNYKYPLVYPQPNSTLVVRPLFNPASGQVLRLINRHEKTACYRTYNQECPICKVMQEVKDATGQDPFGRKNSSKARGICYAQFISSSTAIKKQDGSAIMPGDIILFMFPWTVYQQINSAIQTIAQSPTGMDQAFCHANTGFFIQVQVGSDFKYTTTQNPYMTFDSGVDDNRFMEMLSTMDSLYEQILPSALNENIDKQVKEYADAIYREYIAPRTPNQGVPVNTAPVNFSQSIPTQPTNAAPQINNIVPEASSPAVVITNQTGSSASKPACFGHHEDGNPKCICCPDEMICMQPSDDLPF